MAHCPSFKADPSVCAPMGSLLTSLVPGVLLLTLVPGKTQQKNRKCNSASWLYNFYKMPVRVDLSSNTGLLKSKLKLLGKVSHAWCWCFAETLVLLLSYLSLNGRFSWTSYSLKIGKAPPLPSHFLEYLIVKQENFRIVVLILGWFCPLGDDVAMSGIHFWLGYCSLLGEGQECY
jgi:hypothetical protein